MQFKNGGMAGDGDGGSLKPPATQGVIWAAGGEGRRVLAHPWAASRVGGQRGRSRGEGSPWRGTSGSPRRPAMVSAPAPRRQRHPESPAPGPRHSGTHVTRRGAPTSLTCTPSWAAASGSGARAAGPASVRLRAPPAARSASAAAPAASWPARLPGLRASRSPPASFSFSLPGTRTLPRAPPAGTPRASGRPGSAPPRPGLDSTRGRWTRCATATPGTGRTAQAWPVTAR